jgi:hypothetical protein
MVYLLYLFIIIDIKVEDVLCCTCLALAMIVGGITFLCWIDIPYQEQKILFRYGDEK